mgnify:FL=1
MVKNTTQSEESINEKTNKAKISRNHAKKGPGKESYINVQNSGESLTSVQINNLKPQLKLSLKHKSLQAHVLKNRQVSGIETNFKSSTTTGAISEVSTTVMAPSTTRVQKNLSMGANFAELGAGLIGDTPKSKHSIEFRSAHRSGRPTSLMKNKTIEGASPLGLRE